MATVLVHKPAVSVVRKIKACTHLCGLDYTWSESGLIDYAWSKFCTLAQSMCVDIEYSLCV